VPSSSEPPFPNNVRRARRDALLTQAELMELLEGLAKTDPTRYKSLNPSSLKKLEAGKRRPRIVTARSLCAVLDQDIATLFPLGIDDTARNPTGITRVEVRKSAGHPTE